MAVSALLRRGAALSAALALFAAPALAQQSAISGAAPSARPTPPALIGPDAGAGGPAETAGEDPAPEAGADEAGAHGTSSEEASADETSADETAVASAPAPAPAAETLERAAVQPRLSPHPETPIVDPTAPATPFAEAIEKALKKGPKAVRAAYEAKGFAPIWLDETGAAGPRVAALLAALDHADAHALPPARYRREKLAAAVDALAPNDLDAAANLERALTKSALAFGRDISKGLLEPKKILKTIDVRLERLSPEAVLTIAREAADPGAALLALAPSDDDYKGLLVAYAEARAEAKRDAAGGATLVPAGKTMRIGDRGARVAALRARLIEVGHLDEGMAPSFDETTGAPLFDGPIEDAVRTFQHAAALKVDGVAGPMTIATINKTAADRAKQIAVNLERARWASGTLGERYVYVNIPDFHVELVRDNAVVYRSRVVVGKRRHQTPEFSDEMTHVVVNPTWHVPYSIATEEYLPILKDNPGSLARQDIGVYRAGGAEIDPWVVDWWSLSTEYFPYFLKQGPGPGNALGQVKFIFPNHHHVYLHDTPAKRLFGRESRAFSHGCIRVAKPVELAHVLLGEQFRDPVAAYAKFRAKYDEVYVNLKTPMPVHIVYRTAWIDRDGVLQTRVDVYLRDKAVANALKGAGVAFL